MRVQQPSHDIPSPHILADLVHSTVELRGEQAIPRARQLLTDTDHSSEQNTETTGKHRGEHGCENASDSTKHHHVHESQNRGESHSVSESQSGDESQNGRSRAGACVVIGSVGAVHCRSTKKCIVSKSSTEAELIGMSDSANQAIYMRNFLVKQACEDLPGQYVLYGDQELKRLGTS